MNHTPTTDRICRNCGEKTTGNYCANCGQSNSGGITNWRFLTASLITVFWGKYVTNKKGTIKRYGVPETILQTILHPVTTVEEYLTGKHQKYYGPIAIFMTLSGFYLLLSKISGQYSELQEGWFETDAKTYFERVLEYLNYHPAVRALLQLPFLAFASKWLTRKKLKYNYVQHLYLWIFVYIINNTLLLAQVCISHYLIPINENLQISLNWITKFLYGSIILRYLTHQTWLQTFGQLLLIWSISLLMTIAAFIVMELVAAGLYLLMSPGDFDTILDQMMPEE